MKANAKLIVSLIKRVEVRLPINNAGRTIEVLEQDPITQQTVAAIIEISVHKLSVVVNQLGLVLESISKNIQPSFQNGADIYIPLDVLQSQLFIIRLLSACLQHHWSWYKKKSTQITRETNTTEEALAAAAATGTYNDLLSSNIASSSPASSSTASIKSSFDELKRTDPQIDPPALDETLATFILNLMSRFLYQMHTIEERNEQHTTISSEYVNDALTTASKVDPQTMEYIREVYTTSGKVLYYISASNWALYYAKIKTAVNLSSSMGEGSSESNPPEVRILAFACLNISKLHMILSDLSPYFMNMKIQGKLLFAKMMRMAIWKWIEMRPNQFSEICVSTSRPLAGSEILFDMCNVAADSSRKKAVLWPLQTILLALSPDLIVQAFLDDRGLQNRRTAFPRQLRKTLESTRTQEISAICYVDLCKAATYISPKDDSILRHIAADVEDLLFEKVWDFTRSSVVDTLSSSLGYTISHQALVSDYFLAALRLNSKKALDKLVPTLFLEDDVVPTVFKQAFIHACLHVVLEERTLPWNPTIHSMYDTICTPLRRIFIQTVKLELYSSSSVAAGTKSDASSSNKKGINGTVTSGEKRIYQQSVTHLLQSMLKLFKLDPLTALLGNDKVGHRVEENTALMNSLINLMGHKDKRVRKNASDCLILLNDASHIKYWAPVASVASSFWKITSQTKQTMARFILDNRNSNEDLTKSLLEVLAKLLVSRNAFLRSATDLTHDSTDINDHIQANISLEMALLVSLCSPIPDICSLSIQCLGHLCTEAKLIDEDGLAETTSRSSQTLAGFSHNMEIYEDLSYEKPNSIISQQQQGLLRTKQTFVGRKAQQKRVRRYLRLMTTPTAGVLMAWEEVWKRWKLLTSVVSRFGMDSLVLRDIGDSVSTSLSTASSVKKISGFVRQHEKLRSTSVRTSSTSSTSSTTMPVPVSRIETDDEKQTEWQNYTGFLAALGGCQLAATLQHEEEEGRQKSSTETRLGSPSGTMSVIEKFVVEMVDLLTSENVNVREGAKDTLGGDLSPALYVTLFRHLEQTVNNCFTSTGDIIHDTANTLFAEQTVLVLKMILDRLTDINDCILSADFSMLIIQLANYINRLPHDNYTTMRIRIMMCHLTEVLMLKKEQVIIRDDVKVRNKLLETIVEWTSDFALRSTKLMLQNNSQNKEVQRDLDQVCMKAAVALLKKLPLQSTEQSREVDRGSIKGRLFQKYFTFFTQVLDKCNRYEAEVDTIGRPGSNLLVKNSRDLYNLSVKPSDTYQYWAPLKDLAVAAISNLLSANVDVGLKATLAMGYHDDPKTRTSFIQVLSNILNQGAQFDTLAENIITDRYEQLVQLLVDSDIDVALTLCDVCSSADASGVAKVLLTCYESQGKIINLLQAIIEREVLSTEQEATLFRGTNMATRILSIFARETCIDYLRLTLQPAIERINALPDENLTWEMDPQKLAPHENLTKNKQNVCHATEILLETICSSASRAPSLFRQELALIVEAVNKRFPDASKTAVGGFVFLRLFNPAILTPENAGLSKAALPRSKMVRKLLLQATRMMQNLANNMMFGAKETHLISLNDFITNNLYRVASFLREISKKPDLDQNQEADMRNVRMDNIASVSLHRYLYDNLDKISRELSVRRARTSTDTQKLLEWKRVMDKFSNLLAQLGPPSEVSTGDINTVRNYAFVASNNYYSEFMRRNKHRDLSYISSLNCFFHGGVSKGGRPVFYCVSRNFIGDNFDYELLIYYMLRVMEPYLNHPFELLFDTSRFSEDREIPIHWMNQFFQLVFSEMNDYLVVLHLFNPNLHLQRYIRKLPRILTNKLLKRTRFSNSISELSAYIAPSEIRLPKDTYEMEKETGMTITNAHLVSSYKVLIPVKVKIGREYIIITTLKEQEIFWSLNTILNNVFSMTDITEVFLPSMPPSKKATNEGEIHIVHDTGKSVMTLLVPHPEEVYKYLMERKKSFDSNITDTNHGIRPSDVPGRILNIALLNIGSENSTLRSQAYSLLCSLCASFRFGVDNKLMYARDVCIPFNSTSFIVTMSENLAASEAHLTLEFLNECIVGYNKSSADATRQIITLEYMVPWLKNLAFFVSAPSGKEPSKVKDIIRALLVMSEDKKSKMYPHVQEKIWKTFQKIEELHSLLIDSLVQYSVENGIGSPQAEAMADTVNTMNNNSIRGRVITRMRRVLAKTAQNSQPSIVKHQSWPEIGCLIRFMLMLSFYYDHDAKPYVAEVFHIISMVVSTGPTFIRTSVHEFLVNCIHILVTNKHITDERRKKLKFMLDEVCDGKYRIHFGVNKSHANSFTITEETMTDNMEKMNLASLEGIVRLILDAISYSSPNTDVINIWLARWMSLVTSMTFQLNPALQPRAFVVLGCLARDELDDDLLYQILIVLRNELAAFDERNPDLVISIMMCLVNVIDNLSPTSRYLKSMFWLAISMVQMNHATIFPHAVKLLQSVLRTLDTHKCFDNLPVETVLMEARAPFATIFQRIDEAAGFSFKTQFSFSVACILLKGYKNSDLRESIFLCLMTFLEIEAKSSPQSNMFDVRCLGYLCSLLPVAAKNDTLGELLHLAGIDSVDMESLNTSDVYATIWRAIDIPNNTTGIILVSFLVSFLSLAENESERLFLYGLLSKAAVSTPEVFSLVYDSLIPKMNSIINSTDNAALIETIKGILVTACSEQAFNSPEKITNQKMLLERIGFSGLSEDNFESANSSIKISSTLTSELLTVLCE